MKVLQIIVLLILPIICNGQNSGVATYNIKYGYTNMSDTCATLLFKKDKSYFITTAGPNNTFSLVLHDTLCCPPQKLKSTMQNQSQVYIDLTKNSLISTNELFLTEPYYTMEEPRSINWTIHSDSRVISGYNCLKATGTFRGREYTAWFTKEIPCEFGPWKFNGLPGLIVEVVEKNKHLHFQLRTISFNTKQEPHSLKNKKYFTVPEYLNIFKQEVLKLTPNHPNRQKPSVKTYIDISNFTELDTDFIQ